MQIQIPLEWEGHILREYIYHECHLSHKMYKRLKYSPDGIQINGQHVTVRYVLKENDLLTLATDDTDLQDAHIIPVDLPISIIYEDADVVVPSKPANMPTHPSHDHYTDTVANALAYRYGTPYKFRPVNRLDRNTSGLLLIARNQIAAEKLSRAMREKKIGKTYLAILNGIPQEPEGTISTYMRRTAASIIVREVCDSTAVDGVPAITQFRVIATSPDGYSLVEASPLTGRTHQLRVHFAFIGYPIVGDDLYGYTNNEMGRQALHAYKITFPCPSNGQNIQLCAPLPDDMQTFINEHFSQFTL